MIRLRASLLALACVALGCSDIRADVEITWVDAARLPDDRSILRASLRNDGADEARPCIMVTWSDEAGPLDQRMGCTAAVLWGDIDQTMVDLVTAGLGESEEEGTIRLESHVPIPRGALIVVKVVRTEDWGYGDDANVPTFAIRAP